MVMSDGQVALLAGLRPGRAELYTVGAWIDKLCDTSAFGRGIAGIGTV